MQEEKKTSHITDDQDYRHLSDKDLYRQLYEEVGTVEANKSIQWREEWMRHFHPSQGTTILELGAHNGPNILHYGRLGHVVKGVELSSTLIETFEKQKELESFETQARISMHHGWIEEFTTDTLYDYVLVTEVLEHVPDPVIILKKACECVTENGTVYISSPTTHWGNNTHVRGVPPTDLRIWLQEAGLEVSKIFTEDHGWTFCFAMKNSSLNIVKIAGITRIRNEEAIIQETLDHFSRWCNHGIYVYDDSSTDDTAAICKRHPNVKKVIEGQHWDLDRTRAEYQTREAVLKECQKDNPDWIIYFDADERIDWDFKNFENYDAVEMKLFDFYITEDDKDENYNNRKYLGPEYRNIIMFFKNSGHLKYHIPDQRIVTLPPGAKVLQAGYVKHYGKAISVEDWEKTCDYYASFFPEPYKTKWADRRGKAIHTKSDFKRKLITWEEKDKKGIPMDRKERLSDKIKRLLAMLR